MRFSRELREEFRACCLDFRYFARHVRTEDVDDLGLVRDLPLDSTYEQNIVDMVLGDDPKDWHYIYDMVSRFNDWDIPVHRVEKSRRLIVTTILCAYVNWLLLRSFKEAEDAYKYLDDPTDFLGVTAISVTIKNENDAKKVIKRIRNIWKRLPNFLRRPLATDTVLQIEFENGGLVEGLNAGGHAARLEGYTLSIMDEMAFQENAAENYRALRRCSKKMILVSTANGDGNAFYDTGYDEQYSKGIDQIRIHYSDHPERDPLTPQGVAWLKREMAGTPMVDWRREQEIEYDVYKEPGWFTEDYNDGIEVDRVKWDGHSVIDVSIDPGYVRGGIFAGYWNKLSQLCGLFAVVTKEMTTEEICRVYFTQLISDYPNASFRITGDPAAVQRKSLVTERNENTDAQIIVRMANAILGQDRVTLEYRMTRTTTLQRREGHGMIRRLCQIRQDRRLGLQLDRVHCSTLIKGLKGGYRQPEDATDRQLELEEPNRASDYTHIMDAFRYCVVEFIEKGSLPVAEEKKKPVDYARIQRARQEAIMRRAEKGTLT